jgi:hypothetical protein
MQQIFIELGMGKIRTGALFSQAANSKGFPGQSGDSLKIFCWKHEDIDWGFPVFHDPEKFMTQTGLGLVESQWVVFTGDETRRKVWGRNFFGS